MRRPSPPLVHRAGFFALGTLAFAVLPVEDPDSVRLGSEDHAYTWVRGWRKPAESDLGNTHGAIAFDSKGRVYVNTDTERAVLVYEPDGTLAASWGAELAGGLHGMALVEEDGEELLYLAHAGRGEVLKAKLDGEIVWRIGAPAASGIYKEGIAFRPTGVAVAPNGHLYVADGYGASWIHQYDAERAYVRSFGGPGKELGKLATPHGIHVDTRKSPPVLIVADRENGRLQTFSLEGAPLAEYGEHVRRPCSIAEREGQLVVADLNGRVTILDERYDLVTHLGDNPDSAKWAKNGVPREQWEAGHFLAPHFAAWDAEGNLFVMDWNRFGRVTKLARER